MAIETTSNLIPKNEQGFSLAKGRNLEDVITVVELIADLTELPTPVKKTGALFYCKEDKHFYEFGGTTFIDKGFASTEVANGLQVVLGKVELGGSLTKETSLNFSTLSLL